MKLRVTVARAIDRKMNGLSLTFTKQYSRAWKSQRKALDSPECEAALEEFTREAGSACIMCHYIFEFIGEDGSVVQSIDVPMSGYDHAGMYDPDVRAAAAKIEYIINH